MSFDGYFNAKYRFRMRLFSEEPVDPRAVLAELRDAGVLATSCGDRVLRLTPALNIRAEELARGLDVVDRVLNTHHRAVALQTSLGERTEA